MEKLPDQGHFPLKKKKKRLAASTEIKICVGHNSMKSAAW